MHLLIDGEAKSLVSSLNVNIDQYFYTLYVFIWVHSKETSCRLSSLNFLVQLRVAEINGKRNQSQSQAARLRHDLFNTDYDPELRPVLNMSDKVTVKLGISLHQLIDVVRITLVSLNRLTLRIVVRLTSASLTSCQRTIQGLVIYCGMN